MEIISDCNTEFSPIQKFFSGQNILVTGGTGFVGRVLIEKVLRTCSDINTMYLIIRTKKGKDMHSRIAELFECPIFDKLKEVCPKFQHKVHGVQGDCSLPDLGLSAADKELLISDVTVVFHVAATVRFDEKLRYTTLINLQGTQEIIKLCQQMKGLKALVHVSTAYAHCAENLTDEEFYKPYMEPEKLLTLVHSLDDKVLENIAPFVLGKYPNNYTFTKAMAEELIRKEAYDLPVAVIRPGIVISTYKEPMRGWVDNVYGPTGICMGAGTGVLRTALVDPDCEANIIPADMSVNAIICAAWKASQKHEYMTQNKLAKTYKDIPIYNYVSNVDRPITWKRFMYLCEINGLKHPSMKAIWYYNLTLNRNWIVNWIYTIFLHLLPAVFVDAALICVGKSPQLLKMYIKIIRFSYVLQYFSLRSFQYKNNHMKELWKEMNSKDQSLFPFDMELLDWDDFFTDYMYGIRTYMLKEDMNNLPEARKRWNRLYWLHRITQFMFGVLVIKIIWNIISAFL